MSHIPYTISRSGCYYYNRRVPKHAVKAYGNFVRVALSKCPQESKEYAKRLSYVLEGSWRDTTEIRPVDIISIVGWFSDGVTFFILAVLGISLVVSRTQKEDE